MFEETEIKQDKNIIISINRKEINRISLENAIDKNMTVRDIVMKEIKKSPEIRAVERFFVHVNGKNVLPRQVKNMSIKDVESIEIFDKEP
jgi:hypothetical protein